MDTSVRHLALEFLVTIVEASPAMCRKVGVAEEVADGMTGGDGAEGEGSAGGVGKGSFAALVFPVCFAMMTELPVRFVCVFMCVWMRLGVCVYVCVLRLG